MGMKVRIGIGSIPVGDPELGVGPRLGGLVDELASAGVDSIWLAPRRGAPSGSNWAPGCWCCPALVAAQLAALAALAPGRVLPTFGVPRWPGQVSGAARPPDLTYRHAEWYTSPILIMEIAYSCTTRHHGQGIAVGAGGH